MSQVFRWFSDHRFLVCLVTFTLILLPAILMYYAANNEWTGMLYFLLGLIVLGNMLSIITQ